MSVPAAFVQIVPQHSSMQQCKEKAMYTLVAVETWVDHNDGDVVVLSNSSIVCQLVEQYGRGRDMGKRIKTVRIPADGSADSLPISSKVYALTKNQYLYGKIAASEYMCGEHFNCDSDVMFLDTARFGSGRASFFAPPKPKSVFMAEGADDVLRAIGVRREIRVDIVEQRPWVNPGIFQLRDTKDALAIVADLIHAYQPATKLFVNCVPEEILFNALAWNLGGSSITETSHGMNIFPTWITDCEFPVNSVHFAYTQRPTNLTFLCELSGVRWEPEKTIVGFMDAEITSIMMAAIMEWQRLRHLVRSGDTGEARMHLGWIGASLLWYSSLWSVNDVLDDAFRLPFRRRAGIEFAKEIREWLASGKL